MKEHKCVSQEKRMIERRERKRESTIAYSLFVSLCCQKTQINSRMDLGTGRLVPS